MPNAGISENLALLIELCHIRYMFGSNNVPSADNQQERLIEAGWISGFVDGEGCFSVSFMNQPNREGRRGYTLGVQVLCEFVVTQGEKSIESLEKIRNYFQVGSIYQNKRYDNHREHLYKYVVRKRDDLTSVIIPFFQQYQLQTAKRNDFERFVQCLTIIETGAHLTASGLQEIATIVDSMNRVKNKSVQIMRILNDHTHNTNIIGL